MNPTLTDANLAAELLDELLALNERTGSVLLKKSYEETARAALLSIRRRTFCGDFKDSTTAVNPSAFKAA